MHHQLTIYGYQYQFNNHYSNNDKVKLIYSYLGRSRISERGTDEC